MCLLNVAPLVPNRSHHLLTDPSKHITIPPGKEPGFWFSGSKIYKYWKNNSKKTNNNNIKNVITFYSYSLWLFIQWKCRIITSDLNSAPKNSRIIALAAAIRQALFWGCVFLLVCSMNDTVVSLDRFISLSLPFMPDWEVYSSETVMLWKRRETRANTDRAQHKSKLEHG